MSIYGGDRILSADNGCIDIGHASAPNINVSFHTETKKERRDGAEVRGLIVTALSDIVSFAPGYVPSGYVVPHTFAVFYSSHVRPGEDYLAQASISPFDDAACNIVIFSNDETGLSIAIAKNAAGIRNRLAHEYAHCLVGSNLTVYSAAAGARWWEEGFGDAFALDFLGVEDTAVSAGQSFDFASQTTNMVEQRYSNAPFVAWLLDSASWTRTAPADRRLRQLVEAVSTIPRPEGSTDRQDIEFGGAWQMIALSQVMTRDDAAAFMRAYADGALRTRGGLSFGDAAGPAAGGEIRLSAGDRSETRDIVLAPFRTYHARFDVSGGADWKGPVTLSSEAATNAPILMWKVRGEDAWRETTNSTATFDLDCSAATQILVVGMSTFTTDREMKLQFDLDSAEPCRPDQTTPEPHQRREGRGRRGGHGNGDPHYLTGDGVAYSTQAAGEFWAVLGDDMAIQARHEPFMESQSVASISAVAFKIGPTRVSLTAGPSGKLVVDGAVVPGDRPFRTLALPGGGRIEVSSADNAVGAVVAVWPDGSSLNLETSGWWIDLDLQFAEARRSAGYRGLLGGSDEAPANDLTGRDGVVAEAERPAQVAAFVNSWRIRPTESLFTYEAGRDAASYQMLAFPVTPAAPGTAAFEAARRTCSGSGIRDARLVEACAFDLATTGNQDLLASHQGRQTSLSRLQGLWTGDIWPDIAGASLIDFDTPVTVSLPARATRTFAVDVARRQRLTAYPSDPTCVDGYDHVGAGWQWFDVRGRPLGPAKLVCGDLVGDEVGPGRYYLSMTGQKDGAPVNLTFRAYLIE